MGLLRFECKCVAETLDLDDVWLLMDSDISTVSEAVLNFFPIHKALRETLRRRGLCFGDLGRLQALRERFDEMLEMEGGEQKLDKD